MAIEPIVLTAEPVRRKPHPAAGAWLFPKVYSAMSSFFISSISFTIFVVGSSSSASEGCRGEASLALGSQAREKHLTNPNIFWCFLEVLTSH